MKTIKVGITNASGRSFVVPTAAGTLTVRGKAKLKDQEILELSDDQVEDYKRKGVTFSGLPRTSRSEAPDLAVLEQAVEDAKVARSKAETAAQAPGAGDEQKKALKDAQSKLAAAEKELMDARK